MERGAVCGTLLRGERTVKGMLADPRIGYFRGGLLPLRSWVLSSPPLVLLLTGSCPGAGQPSHGMLATIVPVELLLGIEGGSASLAFVRIGIWHLAFLSSRGRESVLRAVRRLSLARRSLESLDRMETTAMGRDVGLPGPGHTRESVSESRSA